MPIDQQETPAEITDADIQAAADAKVSTGRGWRREEKDLLKLVDEREDNLDQLFNRKPRKGISPVTGKPFTQG